MNLTGEIIRSLEELNMPPFKGNMVVSAVIPAVRTETDRKIAAVELGLSEDAPWGRINRVAEADSVASPCYRR